MKIMVYMYSWDTDDGAGARAFASEAERDEAFKLDLLTYVDADVIERKGVQYDLGEMKLGDLYDLLDQEGYLRGCRFSTDENTIAVSDTSF